MKLEKQDFKRLQWSLLLFVVLAAIGAAVVWTSHQLYSRGQKAEREATANRLDIQTRLARARDEEQELRDKITRYQDLVGKGHVGQERRLDWMEAIGRIKTARRLPDLEYEFSPQRLAGPPLLGAGTGATGTHDIVASAMQMRMSALHEGDLLNFIADLRANVSALIVVRSCSIAKATEVVITNPNATLKAECVLEWVTAKERK